MKSRFFVESVSEWFSNHGYRSFIGVYPRRMPEFVDGDVFKTKISLGETDRDDVGVKLSETEQKVFDCI